MYGFKNIVEFDAFWGRDVKNKPLIKKIQQAFFNKALMPTLIECEEIYNLYYKKERNKDNIYKLKYNEIFEILLPFYVTNIFYKINRMEEILTNKERNFYYKDKKFNFVFKDDCVFLQKKLRKEFNYYLSLEECCNLYKHYSEDSFCASWEGGINYLYESVYYHLNYLISETIDRLDVAIEELINNNYDLPKIKDDFKNKYKKCCRNCKNLNFHDWYFCILKEDNNYIDDIENSKCKEYRYTSETFWK